MNVCADFEELIDREHAGPPLAAAERERLLDHLDGCRSCDELFDLLRELRLSPAVTPAADEPSAAEFAALRRRVQDELERPTPLPFRAVRPRPVSRRGRPATLAAAAALAGLALGWTLASTRPASPRESPAAGTAASGDELFAGQLRRSAARPASFAAAADPAYLFRNVRVSAADAARVRLAFDVSRHLELELERHDPLLAEVLVQALAEPGSAGARLAAIDAAPARLEPKVRRALIAAVREDGNLAVRLRAQQRLAAVAGDAEIADAMLEVLRADASVEMRFAAIDYLTGNQIAPERLVAAIRSQPDDGDRALWIHAREYLSNDVPTDDPKGPQS